MENVKHKILVLSGKGGVGKSSVAVNLAVWLSRQGKNVGLLDIDIHGPSIPKLLHLEHSRVQAVDDKIIPAAYSETLKVMSVGFLLRDETDALIWRGPMKHNVIKQFVTDVCWGDLDYLVTDCPPGTGDEPLSVAQLLGKIDGAVIVTTPQQLAVVDVKKCITFCRKLNVRVLGVIENMSGFVCPHCHQPIEVFTGNGGKEMAREFDVPFLGKIPMDPALAHACDLGAPFVETAPRNPTAEAMCLAFQPVLELSEQPEIETLLSPAPEKENHTNQKEKKNTMKIAIPTTNGKLSAHFGHCEEFALVDVNEQTKEIINVTKLQPPAHEPGVLPKWLSEQKADVIIAGGMGQRAQQLFARNNIKVIVGAPEQPVEELASAFIDNTLKIGDNVCDH